MTYTAAPTTLAHGERFGKLKVLGREKLKNRSGWKYRVGCECGYSGMLVRPQALMSGRVRSCVKCRDSLSSTGNK
jgi:phage-related protein